MLLESVCWSRSDGGFVFDRWSRVSIFAVTSLTLKPHHFLRVLPKSQAGISFALFFLYEPLTPCWPRIHLTNSFILWWSYFKFFPLKDLTPNQTAECMLYCFDIHRERECLYVCSKVTIVWMRVGGYKVVVLLVSGIDIYGLRIKHVTPPPTSVTQTQTHTHPSHISLYSYSKDKTTEEIKKSCLSL